MFGNEFVRALDSPHCPGPSRGQWGPLADLEGRLIGINVRVVRTFSPLHPLGRRFSVAEHPDPAWLQQLMGGHAALAKAGSQSPNQRASGDG